MKNILIYIDYENLHYNLINAYKNVFEIEFFYKLKQYCKKNDYNVLNTYIYCNFDISDMHNTCHQTVLQQYGINTIHTVNMGKNYADMQLTVDLMEQIYINPLVDGVIIISDDKDMLPVVKCIKNKKEFVYVMTSKHDSKFSFFDDYIYLDDVLNVCHCINSDELKEYLYNNLNSYLKSDYIDKKKIPPCLSLEKYVESTSMWKNTFEYEIIRLLGILETENRIIIHRYEFPHNSGNYHIGIVTDKYVDYFSSISTQIDYIAKYGLKQYYDKFNKKDKQQS